MLEVRFQRLYAFLNLFNFRHILWCVKILYLIFKVTFARICIDHRFIKAAVIFDDESFHDNLYVIFTKMSSGISVIKPTKNENLIELANLTY